MANWYGIARTNYVKIKDVDALMNFIDGLPLEVERHPVEESFVCFTPADSDTGDFDHNFCDDDGNDEFWDWPQIAEHLVEGQVLVVMTVGHDKARYLTGYASAISWDGRVVSVNIDDIYTKAVDEFGVDAKAIAFCSYQNLPDVMPEGGAQ